jgi:hypothetical protein
MQILLQHSTALGYKKAFTMGARKSIIIASAIPYESTIREAL